MRFIYIRIWVLFLLISPCIVSGQVKIGEDHMAPHDGAMLELSGTDKGLLYPRVVLTNSTSWTPLTGTATEGMQVFNTSASMANGLAGAGVYVWAGGAWRLVLNGTAAITDISNEVNNTLNTRFGAIGTTFNVAGTDGISYRVVVAKDGRAWTQQNLGATRVATSATDAGAYGDLYQWGRRNDGHEKRNSAWNANGQGYSPATLKATPEYSAFLRFWWRDVMMSAPNFVATADAYAQSQTSANRGCDPCKMILGKQWRMATGEEWLNVIAAEGMMTTSAATIFNTSLKLTLAGSRGEENTGGTAPVGMGTYGGYWTSTRPIYSDPATLNINAASISFMPTGIANQTITTMSNRRAFEAQSIRCINVLK